MNSMSSISKGFSLVFIAIICLSVSLYAQDKSKEAKSAEEEMKQVTGTVPLMFKHYPEHLKSTAWEWFKSTQNPNAAIPPKYSELIALGVASQIPCNFCIYAHTTQAKMHGATDAEIKEAVASAANTRHWSTVLNGAGVDFEEFKAEWDKILEHMKNKTSASN